MPKPATPSNSNPADGDAAGAPADPLQDFWGKNGGALVVICGLALAAVVGKAGWDYFNVQREAALQQDLASADTPEELQAFATAHPADPLGGIAELRLGDQAYATGRIADALDAYDKAAAVIKTGPLAGRIQLGLAMAKIQSGLTSDGETALQQLADDPAQLKAVRAEAAYHLASAAAAAGRADEVQRLAAQIMQLDPDSPWTARAFALQSGMPPAAGAASIRLPAGP